MKQEVYAAQLDEFSDKRNIDNTTDILKNNGKYTLTVGFTEIMLVDIL